MAKRMGRPPNESESDLLIGLLMKQYRAHARNRGVYFLLTPSEFSELVLSNCFYCGQKPSDRVLRKTTTKVYVLACNGIDRIDSKEDYIIANCVPCCTLCNRIKWTSSVGEFRAWVKRLYEHQFGTAQ